MSPPDVTVVVPVYNTMPYLTATLDSLIRQSIGLDRLEVVAVDDGSTDGSGPELDRYAERYRDVIRVVHQPNSGGPAKPCNVGLAAAEGRYVFFLGADDYLGDEALERLVRKADEWQSDVICARIVGVGGRWVNQVLYTQDRRDVPFPSAELASALSNTKLFRRSLLTEHGITYAQDLKVGSDQPFTIEAMLHAQRVSVLGDYDYYYAVKRDDGSNITYSSDWRARLAGISAIVEHIAQVVGPGEGRDLVLGRHFSGEIATLMRRDFVEVGEDEQAELVDAVDGLASRYLTEPMLPRLRVLVRWRFLLARERRLSDLDALAGLDERPAALTVVGHEAQLRYPGLPDSPAGPGDRLGLHLRAALAAPQVEVNGTALDVLAPISLEPGSSPVARLAVSGVRDGNNPPPRSHLLEQRPGLAVAPATYSEGALAGRIDLAGLLAEGRGPTSVGLRVQFDIGERTYGVPLPAARAQDSEVRAAQDRPLVTVRADRDDNTVVDLERRPRSVQDRLRARWGRNK